MSSGESTEPGSSAAPDSGAAAAGAAKLVPSPNDTSLVPAEQATAARTCTNCGARVASHFCPECGQRATSAVHSVSHFLREATEDLTHADSRLWRTLAALLLRPGHLTREFLDGRRARYLPPIRLYLVVSVLFFLLGSGPFKTEPLAAVTISDHGAVSLRLHAFEPESGTETKPNASASERSSSASESENGAHPSAMAPETPQQRAERLCGATPADTASASGVVVSAIRRGCIKVAEDNGQQLREHFLHNFPRAMFLFLPLLALIMKPLYQRPPRYYVEHLLFLVHNQAFVFLLLTLCLLIAALQPPIALQLMLAVAIGFYLPYYFYRSMRRVYEQGHLATTLKFVTLALSYVVFGAITLVLLSVYAQIA